MDPFDEQFFDSLVFLVLTWSRGVALCTMIRCADIVVGWMPVIGGYFVERS
jgi:hypothetical protein